MIKILLSICTYPRKNNKTPEVFSKMCKTLFQNIPENFKLDILIIGDDYPDINNDFKSTLEILKIKYTIVNINENNSLRNMNANKILKWQHACTRSLIYGFHFSIKNNFDYIITFSDDDFYDSKYFLNIEKAITQYNYPDLIFGAGIYCNKIVLPKKFNKKLYLNSPTINDTISSGIAYKCKNHLFIKDIIELLQKRWELIINNLNKPDLANDALMWVYLKPKFNNNIYTSMFIPKVLVYHDTEFTIFQNI